MLVVTGRVRVFIDGFNLYHAIRDTHQPECKWLDLPILCGGYLPPHTPTEIRYFTALAFHKPQASVNRHRAYLRVVEAQGVTVILGRFKEKSLLCKGTCGEEYQSHEEKETDVNLAIAVVEGAILGRYDTAVVVSGDTDILPALRMARSHGRRVCALFPPHRKNDDLADFCDDFCRIKPRRLRACVLPDPYVTSDGAVIHCPPEWR